MNRLIVSIMALAMLVSCVGGGRGDSPTGKVRVPYYLAAEGYPAHVHLKWSENVGSSYEIYRADHSGKFDKSLSHT